MKCWDLDLVGLKFNLAQVKVLLGPGIKYFGANLSRNTLFYIHISTTEKSHKSQGTTFQDLCWVTMIIRFDIVFFPRCYVYTHKWAQRPVITDHCIASVLVNVSLRKSCIETGPCGLEISRLTNQGILQPCAVPQINHLWTRTYVWVFYLAFYQHSHIHEHVVELLDGSLQLDDVGVPRLNVCQSLLRCSCVHDNALEVRLVFQVPSISKSDFGV